MAPRISLALTLHNHQPIGNFGWVMADVCDRAYAPMVEALRRHPSIRVGLHYSGPLLEWLERERRDVLDGILELAGRGQVELLGGGLHEPILVALPDVDRREQLLRMADRLERLGGVRPRGAWLAERVWEPDLPRYLADAAYEWTIVDDAHLRGVGLPDDAAFEPWLTEDQGRRIAIFATDQWLRYRIPFGPVDEVIARLRAAATLDGERLATMGDDGEMRPRAGSASSAVTISYTTCSPVVVSRRCTVDPRPTLSRGMRSRLTIDSAASRRWSWPRRACR